MKPTKSRVWTICESISLLIPILGFITFGIVAIRAGDSLPGAVFASLGVLTGAYAVFWLFAERRIGVQITGKTLVICSFFSKKEVALDSIVQVYRSVDATVIRTASQKWVLEDSYFSNPSLRNALLKRLREELDPSVFS